jgi:hypothetical protein
MTTRQPPLEYRLLDGSIHEFIYHRPTHEAVDLWGACLDAILDGSPPGILTRFLYDNSRCDMIPLMHALKTMRGIVERHPNRPDARIAVLYGRGFLMNVAVSMNNLLARRNADTFRFYRGEERDEALSWLRGSE